MRGCLDLNATEKLAERKAYVLCKVLRNEQDEEYTENIVVDGACMRTPEEDIKWAEEQAELEAAGEWLGNARIIKLSFGNTHEEVKNLSLIHI